MVKSMTGFGRAVGHINNNQVTVEIKSLNSKFLEINLRLAQSLRDREMDIRQHIMKTLERGKIDISISVDETDMQSPTNFNRKVIDAYITELQSIATQNNIVIHDMLSIITALPNAVTLQKNETDDEAFAQLMKVVNDCIANFDQFRKKEGEALQQDLLNNLQSIENHLEQINSIAPHRIENIKQRILLQLEAASENITVDKNRFEQELIYFLERLDINEEKVRLISHLNYFTDHVKGKEVGGKKLGFIIQEMGREINTMGAKANDAAIQVHIINMKDDLEKMKEQVLNIV
ncbi:MAG TPA: YicC family protein [Bacteroidia bacterium]|nr:YicC family protein [Bacteroidia bacterium]